MDAEKVRLTKEQETESFLVTVYGKALDSRVKDSILGDTYADEALRRIDFDFKKLKIPRNAEVSLPIRAKHLDGWTREFLAVHPSATVLHLGCGLDSRAFRVDPPATVRWYDVDQADVIELRRRIYPERHDYSLISASVTEPGWLDAIPVDRPVLVVAEGLTMHLPEKEGLALFARITEKFSSGQFVFDAYGSLPIRVIMFISQFMKTRVHLQWAIDDPRKLETQVPRLKVRDAVAYLMMPELHARLKQNGAQRAITRFLGQFAWYRTTMQHVRCEF